MSRGCLKWQCVCLSKDAISPTAGQIPVKMKQICTKCSMMSQVVNDVLVIYLFLKWLISVATVMARTFSNFKLFFNIQF